MHIDDISSRLFGQILFEEANDGGSGDGEENLKVQKGQVLSDDVLKSIKGLVSRAGNESEALKIVYHDNKNLRDQLRESQGAIGKNQVVVDKAKAEMIKALEEREISSVEDLTKTLESFDTTKKELDETRRQIKVTKAKDIHNANTAVLEKLLKSDGLDIETGTAKDDDGNEVEVVYVVDGDKKTTLEEYADKEWAEFKQSLFSGGDDDSQNTGRKFVKQSQGKVGKGSGDRAKKFLEERNKRVKTGNPIVGKQEN